MSTASVANLSGRLPGHHAELVDLGAFFARKQAALEDSTSIHGRVVLRTNFHEGCFVTSMQAVYLALALDEILVIAFHHAPDSGIPVAVDVDCTQARGGSIVLTITDDGTGYEVGSWPMDEGEASLKLLQNMARGAGAALFVQASPLGVSYRFVLPSVALV